MMAQLAKFIYPLCWPYQLQLPLFAHGSLQLKDVNYLHQKTGRKLYVSRTHEGFKPLYSEISGSEELQLSLLSLDVQDSKDKILGCK